MGEIIQFNKGAGRDTGTTPPADELPDAALYIFVDGRRRVVLANSCIKGMSADDLAIAISECSEMAQEMHAKGPGTEISAIIDVEGVLTNMNHDTTMVTAVVNVIARARQATTASRFELGAVLANLQDALEALDASRRKPRT